MQNSTKNIVGLILISLSFIAGFYYHEFIFQEYYKAAYSIDGIDFSLLKKAWDQVSTDYVDQSKIDKTKMTYGAISGMVNAIGDPYTEFFNPEEAKKLEQDLAGSFEGIGLQLGIKNNQITAISPIKGTPAEKAGLRPGDMVLAVNAISTSNLSLDEVVNMIRGPKDTKVTLTISREGAENKDIVITRAVIKVPSMDYEIKEVANGKKIAIITLYQFSDTVYQDFKTAAIDILNNNVSGIILDMRSNPGGLVNQATSIAGWFLDKGQLILSEQDKNGEKTELTSNGPSNFASIPLVVLINDGSASASEILAGALKDDRKVPIIGVTSFGKGTVQQIINLDDGSSLKITTAKWYTPSGVRIQDTGIEPDIKVDLTQKDYEQNKDPQLDRALQELEKIIK
ncbi:MAG TPA: S41 family peptidase [Candidatus Pacearchaeota archaeon]|nr:S41 family peptidase [Candidatus Pacearchaeota archaeon]HPR80057.1 S41 family peptidase [Candidatus Pacearchaeota archaeon]